MRLGPGLWLIVGANDLRSSQTQSLGFLGSASDRKGGGHDYDRESEACIKELKSVRISFFFFLICLERGEVSPTEPASFRPPAALPAPASTAPIFGPSTDLVGRPMSSGVVGPALAVLITPRVGLPDLKWQSLEG